jgi:predicted lipoprotein
MKIFLSNILLLFVISTFFSCVEKDPASVDNFDRKQSLTFIADRLIIPSWENYLENLDSLKSAHELFKSSPNEIKLIHLRNTFEVAWISWQKVSLYDIGKGEELSIRNYTNIYPCETDQLLKNIESSNYNLELPSTYDEQGFPAIDFLLFGISNSNIDIINLLKTESYSKYLTELINKLYSLCTDVLNSWNEGYSDEFIANDGSSATASYDMLVNDFLFYYEKHLRAGKIGIPAGVFSVNPLPQNVESNFNKSLNKRLFLASLETVENFFNGKAFDENIYGNSLAQYSNSIADLNLSEQIAELVNANWATAKSISTNINEDFNFQIESDNVKMLELFDALQKNVILLKVDMLQQLNIQVDFVDADGD